MRKKWRVWSKNVEEKKKRGLNGREREQRKVRKRNEIMSEKGKMKTSMGEEEYWQNRKKGVREKEEFKKIKMMKSG